MRDLRKKKSPSMFIFFILFNFLSLIPLAMLQAETKKPDSEVLLPAVSAPEEREQLLEELFSITKGQEKLKVLSSLSFEDYPQQIGKIREEVAQFLENKRGVCTGEYLPIILNEPAFAKFSSRSQVRKLTLNEKKVCFKNLFDFQKVYLTELFSLRKKYLNYLHQKRIQDLDQIQVQTMKKLNEDFQKIAKEQN